MPRYRSIQALRFLAAMLVVCFHLGDGHFITGAAGVDIFFVISGFIMGTVGTRESPRSFLVKRAIRIVPLYWAVTLLMCAAATAGAFTHFSFDTSRLIRSLLFIPYYEVTGDLWPLVVIGWTLNVEMFFYGLFALGLRIGMPVRFAIGALTLLALAGGLHEFGSAILRQWTTPLLMEFVAGLLLATAVKPAGLGAGAAMIGLGAAWFAVLGAFGIFDQAFRLLTWGVPAVLVVGGAVAIERGGRWPDALRPLEVGGDASYSLYLLHGLVISMAQRGLGGSLPAKVATVALAILVSLVSFRVFEKPVGAALSRLARRILRGPADHRVRDIPAPGTP